MGEVRTIRGKELDVFRINLGLLGIVIEVELETVESFKLEFSRKVESDSIVTSGAAVRLARNSDYLQLQWFPRIKKVAVARGLYRDKETEGNAFTPFYEETDAFLAARLQAAFDSLQEERRFRALYAVEENALLGLTEKVVDSTPMLTDDGVNMKSPAVGWNFNLTMDSCRMCDWSHGTFSTTAASFGCDLRKFKEIVRMIREVVSRLPLVLPLRWGGVNFRLVRPQC